MYTIGLSTSITIDRLTTTITDNTIYGGANPSRNSVLTFISGDKIKFDNSVAEKLVLTPDNLDPLFTLYWTHEYKGDGWYNYNYVIIKDIWSLGITFNKYDTVYDQSTNLVYRSKIDSNLDNLLSDSTSWELILDPSLLAKNKEEVNESLNIDSTIYQRILTFNSQYGYGNFVSENCESCCGGDCGDEESNKTYQLLSLLVNGAIEADLRSELPQGETICRRIESILA